jgi:hypothetical protein
MRSHIVKARRLRRSEMYMRRAVLSRPWASDPDELRHAVQAAVSSLDRSKEPAICRRLIGSLAELGLNVPAILYLSGIVEQEPADLTPAEIAHLIRYVRINAPWALVEEDKLFAELEPRPETRKAA